MSWDYGVFKVPQSILPQSAQPRPSGSNPEALSPSAFPLSEPDLTKLKGTRQLPPPRIAFPEASEESGAKILKALPPWPPHTHTTSHPFSRPGPRGPGHDSPLALHRRLKTSMSNKAATTRQLSEYLKHAKGRTRTAIRNGQVWEESLKRLRQKAASTNVTGTESPLAHRGQEGVVSSQERAEGTKSCVPSEEPSLREALLSLPSQNCRARRGSEDSEANALFGQRKELRAQEATLSTPSEGTCVLSVSHL